MKRSPAPTLFGLIALAVCIVPCLFSTRVGEVFAVPKLVALWVVLAISLWIIGLRVLRETGPAPKLVWVRPVDVAVVAFVALNALAFAFSTDHEQSFFGERFQHQGVATLVLYLSYFVLARWLVTSADVLVVLVSAISVGGLVVALYGLAQRTSLDPVWHGDIEGGRIFSTIGQSNALAGYLVLVIALAGALLVLAKRRVKAAVAAIVVVMCVALALTSSRGGEAALVVVAAIFAGFGWWRSRGDRARQRRAALAVGLVSVVVLVGPGRQLVTDAWDRATTSTEGTNDVSIRDHVYFWQVALRITRDHPLLGTGQETYPDQFPSYSRKVLDPDDAGRLNAYRVESPHNVPLTIASSTGVPALVAYLAIMVGVVATLLQAARRTHDPRLVVLFVAVVAVVAGHVVSDLFRTEDLTEAWLFWLIVGAALGVATHPAEPAGTAGPSLGDGVTA
jgi:putative inorganic carbon (hco3(-)) transporter